MAVLTTKQRKALAKSDFANPGAGTGSGSYPMPDKSHARAALSYIRYASPQTAARIRSKAKAMGLGPKAPKRIQGK